MLCSLTSLISRVHSLESLSLLLDPPCSRLSLQISPISLFFISWLPSCRTLPHNQSLSGIALSFLLTIENDEEK
ncbi:hypothetical protein Syun_026101 [Stephania yunnanensis]|uniref:Uncharacterized protein n=1 Tax=Stephania yunnanensis TaxID=152371 RepID=A0AAP0ETN6_9MAGN